MAKNDDQLAFVLAHEIAHWENGDIRNNHAKIPVAPGQISDAECSADLTALELLPQNINAVSIKKWLGALRDEVGRNPFCEL